MAIHSATLDIKIDAKVLGAAAVIGFGKSVIDAASDAEQAMGSVDAVFKGNAGAVKSWSDQSAKSIGLSKTEYQTLATTIGAQLKNAGTSMSDLAPKTNDLITMGADLAAQYGGSTSDAVSALSSLLKGERDPIEKYGVSITAAAVAAKKAEMGLSGLTGQADAAATQQATLALLTTQTADALGANAREAETTAGKQARLTAAWKDAQATIGAALLPAFTSLMGAASDLLPKLVPIATALADLVTAASKLPVPVLAGGVALAAFMKYSGTVQKTLKGMGDGTIKAGEGFKSLGKSMAKGAAIGAAVAVVGSIADSFADIGRQAEAQKAKVNELADTIVAAGGKWTKTSQDLVTSQTEQSTAFKLLTEGGASYGDAMDLLSGKTKGSSKSQELMNSAMKASGTPNELIAITKSVGEQQRLIGSAKTLAAQKIAYNKTQDAATAATNQENQALDDQAAAAAKVVPTVAELAKAQAEANTAAAKAGTDYAAGAAKLKDLQAASIEAAAGSTDMAGALTKAGSAADAAKRATDGLNLALDVLSHRNQTTEQTAAGLNKSMSGLKDGFTAATGEAAVNKKELLAWNVPALTVSSTGQKAYDSLNNVRDAYSASTAAAFTSTNATKGVAAGMTAGRVAADSARKTFISNAASMGLNASEAGVLADKLGIVEGKKITNKEFEVIGKDADAQQKLKDLQAKQIAEKTVKVNADTTSAEHAITRLTLSRDMTIYAKTVASGNGVPAWTGPGTGSRSIGGEGAALMGMDDPVPFAAPGIPIRVRMNVPSQGTTVNVFGALDPVAVGRQVSGLLSGQSRRSSGIRIGGTA